MIRLLLMSVQAVVVFSCNSDTGTLFFGCASVDVVCMLVSVMKGNIFAGDSAS